MNLKPKHLSRYREVARLFWRHGRSDIFRKMGEAAELKEEEVLLSDGAPSPEELVRDLEKMGPTYVKFGQLLSSRADLIPAAYLRALARLQDNVKPFPFAQVEKIVQAELGVRLSKAFQHFESEPLAAASLGQVHRAILRDGREVAVKVQRPDIRGQIAEDLDVMDELAGFAEDHTEFGRRYRLRQIVEQFRRTISQELDYTREAANLVAVGENLAEFPHIRTVQPIADYSTREVLTMTYLRGWKITELNPVVRMDLDGNLLADELFQAYLKQILVDGLFHADPHPGNVLLTEDGCVGLLDLGMVGRVTPGMQEHLIKMLLAVSEGRSEDAINVAVRISQTSEQFDLAAFRRRLGDLVAEMHGNTLNKLDVGRVLLEVGREAGATGLFVPSELTLLGKTLLQLHEIGNTLAPAFDPNAAIRKHVGTILEQRLRKDLTPGNLFASVLEVKQFMSQLPNRVNKVFDALGRGQVELKVRADDTLRVVDGFQKVANRVAAGLLLASLIIGAALLMQVPTQFQLFGYPGLAIIFFLLAASGGIWLLCDIFFRDTKQPRRR
jgi:ubiquinone biosynthesis protein